MLGCGSTGVGSQSLIVQMRGAYKEPKGVKGNSSPKYVITTIDSVSLKKKGGKKYILLGKNLKTELRIIDRDQIIFEDDLADYDGETFSEIKVTFKKPITVGGLTEEKKFTLSSGDVSSEGNFTVETGKDVTATVKVYWKNTIKYNTTKDTETFEEPEYNVSVEVK